MTAFDVAVKTLKEALRQPRNLALTLGLPVAFMVIFGFAFGGTQETTYEIAVWNEDAGDLGDAYVDGLAALEYGSGKRIVAVTNVTSEAQGRALLTEGDTDHFVHVPANFTEGLTPPPTTAPGSPVPTVPPQPQPPPPQPEGSIVYTLGNPGSASSQVAAQIVSSYTQAFAQEASRQPPLVTIDAGSVAADELTTFDFIAPGLMIYAVLSLVPQAAAALARETELKTIDRIRLSPMRASTLLAGVALAELVLASISVALMLATARLMGFHNQGSYLDAYAIALVAAVGVLGIGMLIAAFARIQQEAANFGVLVTVPASFLSGAFFPLPAVVLGAISGVEVGLYDLLPTTHSVEAMRQVMTFGDGLGDVLGQLAASASLGLAFFAVGVWLFSRRRLAPE